MKRLSLILGPIRGGDGQALAERSVSAIVKDMVELFDALTVGVDEPCALAVRMTEKQNSGLYRISDARADEASARADNDFRLADVLRGIGQTIESADRASVVPLLTVNPKQLRLLLLPREQGDKHLRAQVAKLAQSGRGF